MMVSYLSLHNSNTKLQGFSSDDSLMYTVRVSFRNFILGGSSRYGHGEWRVREGDVSPPAGARS